MLDKIRAVWALLPAALRDAGALLKRYWWYVVLMSAFDATVAALALRVVSLHQEHLASASAAIAAGLASTFFTLITLGGFWLLLYSHATRIAKPGYRFTADLIGRLFGYYLMLCVITVLFKIPGYVVEFGVRQIALATVVLALCGLFAHIRFGFTLFALEFDEHPFRLSWQISGGSAFVGIASALVAQAIIVEGVAYLMNLASYQIAFFIGTGPGVIIASVIAFAVTALATVLTLPVMVPWVMRMMLAFAEFPAVAQEEPSSVSTVA